MSAADPFGKARQQKNWFTGSKNFDRSITTTITRDFFTYWLASLSAVCAPRPRRKPKLDGENFGSYSGLRT